MVVVLKKRVQLRAMVSTSGVLADENRRVAAPRFADARNPPTGENAASGGASSRATTYGTIGPRKAAATTRKIAFSSDVAARSEEHTSELQSRENLVCRLLLEKKKKKKDNQQHIRKQNQKK